ncbi:hypothetical protein [Streptomyces olivochromogenes]|uniref:hypothetical protein n=1 Tax=Streptomyces olivochromogenes TaxID=1963 RepID=UPI001F157495|nr:hypothetical protein [Streptomyces olivochromogenes]MCF3132269.1 hypothetical protein [Streptomyces olivochromogenes]
MKSSAAAEELLLVTAGTVPGTNPDVLGKLLAKAGFTGMAANVLPATSGEQRTADTLLVSAYLPH